MTLTDKTKFTIVAGQDLIVALEAEKVARVPQNAWGFESEKLCEFQRDVSGRGIIGAEVVCSNYGHSVRYDSGLQNFGLLAGSRSGQLDGSLEAAETWARAWVAKDPTRRYAWKRNR